MRSSPADPRAGAGCPLALLRQVWAGPGSSHRRSGARRAEAGDRVHGQQGPHSARAELKSVGSAGRQFKRGVDSCQATPRAPRLLGQSCPRRRLGPSPTAIGGHLDGGFADAQEHLRQHHVQPGETHAWHPYAPPWHAPRSLPPPPTHPQAREAAAAAGRCWRPHLGSAGAGASQARCVLDASWHHKPRRRHACHCQLYCVTLCDLCWLGPCLLPHGLPCNPLRPWPEKGGTGPPLVSWGLQECVEDTTRDRQPAQGRPLLQCWASTERPDSPE